MIYSFGAQNLSFIIVIFLLLFSAKYSRYYILLIMQLWCSINVASWGEGNGLFFTLLLKTYRDVVETWN